MCTRLLSSHANDAITRMMPMTCRSDEADLKSIWLKWQWSRRRKALNISDFRGGRRGVLRARTSSRVSMRIHVARRHWAWRRWKNRRDTETARNAAKKHCLAPKRRRQTQIRTRQGIPCFTMGHIDRSMWKWMGDRLTWRDLLGVIIWGISVVLQWIVYHFQHLHTFRCVWDDPLICVHFYCIFKYSNESFVWNMCYVWCRLLGGIKL